MRSKILIITLAISTGLLFTAAVYAGGGMSGGGQGGMGSSGGGMMGSGGGGMMGSGHGGMMGSSPNFSTPRTLPPNREIPTDQQYRRERERLRDQIQQKRQELSELYHSEQPDKALIDQKIAELNDLEKAHDSTFSGAN